MSVHLQMDEEPLKYCFRLDPVPRLNYLDPDAERLIARNQPVLLTDSDLVESALKWDLDYLSEHLGSGSYHVFTSETRKFKYYDEAKLKGQYSNFVPPTRKQSMKIGHFAEKLKNWKVGDKRLYFQQVLNDTVGKKIVQDFLEFNWKWVTRQQQINHWGCLTSNLLLIGNQGNITPLHYDEQQNFFAQIRGSKRFLLFPPDQFECFYPHPVWHPHDRQSQVELDEPDYERFPLFKEAHGYEAVVNPGDVLYLPAYWWHQVESLYTAPYTISVNFWYKCGPTGPVMYPLKGHQKMTIMRNMEKMLLETLKDPNEVSSLLKAMVYGRLLHTSCRLAPQ